MSKDVKFDIESYKEKLSKMTDTEFKEEWDKILSPIRKCYEERNIVENNKKQFSSSGVRF